MKKLTKFQSAIFTLGGLMLIAGAVAYFFSHSLIVQIVYGFGAMGYVFMQWLQRYEGDDLTLQRLRKLQVISGVLILMSAALMVANDHVYEIFAMYKIDVYNYWVICLFIGVFMQLYTILRMDKELQKKLNNRS